VNGPEADWIVGEPALEFGYHARLIGTVAQLVEQGPFKALVLGSSPSRPTIKSTTCAYNRSVCTEIVRKNSAIMRRSLEVFALVPFDPSLPFIADPGGFQFLGRYD
jgi:hypothetical protein